MKAHNPGFTMVELLVVIAIIALLAGLMLAAAASTSERGRSTETKELLGKVAAGIERFQGETGYYPMATGSSADAFPGMSLYAWYPAGDEGWERQALFWRLGQSMSDDDKRTARDAAETAALAINPVLGKPKLQGAWRGSSSTPSMSIVNADEAKDLIWLQGQFDSMVADTVVDPFRAPTVTNKEWVSVDDQRTLHGVLLKLDDFKENWGEDRVMMMTRGWAKLEVMRQRGVIAKADGERARTTMSILGLADIADRYRDGDQILDAWGVPLGYINASGHSVEGTRTTNSKNELTLFPISTKSHARVALTDRDDDGTVDLDDLLTAPPVDDQVDHDGNGTVDARDWGSLLWNALPGYERGFVLLSAGPDGLWPVVHGEAGSEDDILFRGGQE